MGILRSWASIALACACLVAHAKVEITTNLKDGDKIAGEVLVRVTVKTDDLVSGVEFTIGDELRSTDDSTPYEMRIDTVAETEGALKLKIGAFTTNGQRAETTLNLVVDNELGKGPEHHVGLGNGSLSNSKFDEAIIHGRVALKAKSDFLPAKLLLARANFGKGILDSAEKFCGDVLTAEPNNLDALDLQAAIQLSKAFRARVSDPSASTAAINSALKAAAKSRGASLIRRLEELGQPTDANLKQWADTALRAGRFTAVINRLGERFRANPRDTAFTNRYLIALLRDGRMDEFNKSMAIAMRRGSPDAVTHILSAIHLQFLGKDSDSLAAEAQAIRNDPSDLTVRSGQAALALMRGRMPVAGQVAADLANEEGSRWEVQMYLSAVQNSRGDYDDAKRSFEAAVLNEPASIDAYVQRANQLIAFGLANADSRSVQLGVARGFFEAALEARPESHEALLGLALLNYLEGKAVDGMRLAEAALKASPEYPAAHYLVAVGSSLEVNALNSAAEAKLRQATDARSRGLNSDAAGFEKEAQALRDAARSKSDARTRAFRRAGELDPFSLSGVGSATPNDVWRYFATRGRTPTLIPVQY